METKSEQGIVERAITWKTYTYIWPLLGRLAELSPADRERLDVGPDSLGEDALVLVETATVDLMVALDGEEIPTNSIVVPVTLHHVPYVALCHETETGVESMAMAFLRRAFHEMTGKPPRPGQRFLDVLLAATRPDQQERLRTAEAALTSALEALQGRNQPRLSDSSWMTEIDALYRDLDRQRAAERLYLAWGNHGGKA